MESTVSRLSKGAKYPSFTAAEIASSTRWLRGMKAGLAQRIAVRRAFASPPSSASRWRHLARHRHVVGVHDAMNEADELPLRYKRRLARDHQVEEGAVPVRRVNRLWVMPRDDVISEAPDRIQIPLRCEELEGADTDVARRDAGQYRAGQTRLAPNRLAGRHSGERSGRRNPERRHRLAD